MKWLADQFQLGNLLISVIGLFVLWHVYRWKLDKALQDADREAARDWKEKWQERDKLLDVVRAELGHKNQELIEMTRRLNHSEAEIMEEVRHRYRLERRLAGCERLLTEAGLDPPPKEN